MKWIEETDVLEMIVEKFSSSVSSFLRKLSLPQECLLAFSFSSGDSFFLANSDNFSAFAAIPFPSTKAGQFLLGPY